MSLLEIHLKRIKKSKQIDNLIVATTDNVRDDVIVQIAQNENIEFYRGNLDEPVLACVIQIVFIFTSLKGLINFHHELLFYL